MNKEMKKGLVPKLRFPEFRDSREWEEKSLGTLGNAISGLTGKSGSDFGSGELFVTYKQVFDSARINFAECNKVIIAENEKQNKLQYGDILFTTSSETANEVGFASVILDNPLEPVYLNSFCFSFRPYNLNELPPEFSYYLFHSPIYRKSVIILAQGITRFNISKTRFLNLTLPLPNKPEEQTKIAACLSSLDDLITAQTQKIKALKTHKKGLMQQLFPAEGEAVPKLRFPEFQNEQDWKKIKFIETVDKKIKWSFIGGPFGSNLKSSDYTDNGGVRIIQLQNIGDAEFLNEYKIFTSEEKADELLSCNIYPNDIILSKMGDPVGRACLIPNNHERYVMCSDGIRLVVDEKSHNKYFIYSLINAVQFRALVEKTATGSTRKRIGLDDLRNLPMTVPKVKEQTKIAACLSSLDEFINAQTKKLDALKLHKKGLMQGLFPVADDGANG